MTTSSGIMVQSFGSPEVLQIGQKTLPDLAGTQVLISMKAAGVNPSDTYIRLGPEGPYAANPHLLPPLPYTPGKDGAGVVQAVGAEVDGLKVGDRVYTAGSVTGTYASHTICERKTVYPLPDPTSFAQGACMGVPCATAYYALHFRAGLSAGQRVFIHGASGAVGLAAVQLAKRISGPSGLVVGSAGTEAGEAAVRAAGADKVVNHRAEGYQTSLKKEFPQGFDVILEMSAHTNLPADLSLAARRGKVCIIGSKSQEVAVNPRHFMSNEVEVRGVFLPMAVPEEIKETHAALFQALADGSLKPAVSSELPLAEAPTAHKEVMNPSAGGSTGNIVLIP